VAHVELTCDVRRGNNDGVVRLGAVNLGGEMTVLAPFRIYSLFKFFGRIGLSEFFFHNFNLSFKNKKALTKMSGRKN
jgi:hypothetical protein